MKYRMQRLTMLAALAAAFAFGPAHPAFAGAGDYQFELVNKEVKAGKGTEFAVRLVHRPDGKAVPDAVIFATRLDMGPDSMEEMTTPVTPVPGGEPGVYRFKANFSMAGSWALSLGAKVQGEAETVQGKLILKAQ
jgi:hypothetical protein